MENWRNDRKHMEKRVAKADVILLACLLLTGIVCFFALRLMRKNGTTVRILADGELYATYDLNQDRDIPITIHGKEGNTLQIADHKAKMIWADCPDQLCVHQKAISGQGETIVCLPNKIVVEIAEGEDADLDAISR